jgi:putative transposase
MSNQMYPTDLTDRQWDCIKDLLPCAKPGGRPRSLDLRHVLNAIFYLLKTGCQWRMLPQTYPKWQSVYYYFRVWRDSGVWHRLHAMLRAAVRRAAGRHKHPTAGCLDSQSVKMVAGPGMRGYDSGKKVKGRKRHLLVDTQGLVLSVIVTAANVSDPAGAYQVFARMRGAGKKLRKIWVDGTYRGTLVEWAAAQTRFRLAPVVRSADQKGFVVLPRRWVVERTFGWLVQYRRLRTEYEQLPASSEALIYLAMTRLMLRRLAA